MTKRLKSLLFAIIAIIATTFSSCNILEDPYYPSVIGTWELNFDQIGPINPDSNLVDKFAFYADGTGSYGFWDKFGYWQNSPFIWSQRGYYLTLVYTDGFVEYDYYKFHNGYLYLSQTDDFYKFGAYRPVPRSSMGKGAEPEKK